MTLASILTRLVRRTLDLVLLALVALVVVVVLLARVIPAVTGGTTFVVGGGSMEPVIPFGSAVVVTPVAESALAVGDVVSIGVGSNHTVFTHRIVRLVDRDGRLWLQTRGDANQDADPSIVPASSVIGRLAVSVPYAGFGIRLLSSAAGLLFLVALGLVVLAAAWLLETLEDDLALAIHKRARRAARAMLPEPFSGQGAAG